MRRSSKSMSKSGLRKSGSTRIRTPMSGYRIKGRGGKHKR